MLRFLFRRALLAVTVALVASFLSFALINGSRDVAAALAGESATQADIEIVRQRYGLDRSLLVQYADWLSGAVRGEFGDSVLYRRPVLPIITEHAAPTLQIGLSAILLALAISVPVGCLMATRRGGAFDRIASALLVANQAMPGFWISLLLIYIFAVQLRWLPAAASGGWQSYILPVLAVTLVALPPMTRMMKAGMIDTLRADFMRTARSKGIGRYRIVLLHALPNAVTPLVALLSVQFGAILAGSVVIEVVFSVKGLGYLAWYSITTADFAIVQAVVLVITLIYAFMTLLMDALNYWLDPRARTRS
ncbi:MAG: ABC transporter permease [Alphaproteobacteria bacterium]|nr:ABC transporter permease [Alphaproteobacteria bacterium]